MSGHHRVFVASVATETNTFSPLRTDLEDFKASFYAAPGEHPRTPTLCSAVFPSARKAAKTLGWEVVEGTATWAEPGGIVNAATWHYLRDQLLDELRAAMPVDIVLLGLHGAMVAQDCDDCEGELLALVREIVGADTVVGATLDPHSHLSAKRSDNADLLVVFKEFPHTDFVVAAERLCSLAERAASGVVTPEISVFDCRMIEILPTNRDPMRSFIDKINALEDNGDVLSISVVHGFMAGDVADLGTKVLVITDNNASAGDALAHSLGMELFGFRGTTRPDFRPATDALDRAVAAQDYPVIIADVWDNPGGGVPGDNTRLVQEILQRGLRDVAVATIWDPIAVRTCFFRGRGRAVAVALRGQNVCTKRHPD